MRPFEDSDQPCVTAVWSEYSYSKHTMSHQRRYNVAATSWRCSDVVKTLCLLGRALSVAKDLECAQADSEYYLSLHWAPMQSFKKCWDPVHMCDSTVLRNPGLRSDVQRDSESFALDPCIYLTTRANRSSGPGQNIPEELLHAAIFFTNICFGIRSCKGS